MGAEAIIDLQVDVLFKSPLPWRVTAPTSDGVAVKITFDPTTFDCAAQGGRIL